MNFGSRLLAEAVGTFALVMCGAGAIIINELTQGSVTHVGISLVFGLIVLAVIYAVGDVSGAHINPAVTLGFALAGRCPIEEVLPYWAAQGVGAVLASASLATLFPDEVTVSEISSPPDQAVPVAQTRQLIAHGHGATRPWGSRQPTRQQVLQAFGLEVFLTGWLMLVVLSVSRGPHERGITAGIVVGAVIALEALFAGPISGASMNPIRSFGPALMAGELTHSWFWLCYVAGPFLGAAGAIPLFQIIHRPARGVHLAA
ncbi:MAG: hypothetical protein KatS3mg114_0289 [Planctomycetaceae bacterium]|nr:MAG: hypothetical protein KatS3mg114_0289 [Planctomycetaceae bacterium]